MAATTREFDDTGPGEPMAVLSRADAEGEDAHWAHAHRRESYFKPAFDYEDYAPAYCVGYIGHAQYGGHFEEALKSLSANWERIKGDSRLPLEEALLAMRAAWDRMARGRQPVSPREGWVAGLLRRRLPVPSLRFGPRLQR